MIGEMSDELVALRATVADFARAELAPTAAERDRNGTLISRDLIAKMADLGLLGLTMPEKHGGLGLGAMAFSVVLEEIARADTSAALTLLIHTGVASKCIWQLGSEEQQARYIPDLAAGRRLCAFAMTEPSGGSDATSMRTRATRDADAWRIDGNKCFISNGSIAEVFTVLAKTDPTRKGDGISAFIVEKSFPGFSVVREEDFMGLRAGSGAELLFDDCRVPAENVLALAPTAFKRIMEIFNGERIGNSSVCLGVAQGALEAALSYVSTRQAFGQRIGDFQGVQWMLADMAIQVEATRLMVHRAAEIVDSGHSARREVAMAKVMANEMSLRVCDTAMQLHGGNGYTREFPLERMYRDVRAFSFGGGTPQIQRTNIGRWLLQEWERTGRA